MWKSAITLLRIPRRRYGDLLNVDRKAILDSMTLFGTARACGRVIMGVSLLMKQTISSAMHGKGRLLKERCGEQWRGYVLP